MLTLAAVYNSGLSELIERDKLEALFERTIRFLLSHGSASPVLSADARALAQVYSKLFGYPLVLV